MNAHALLTSQGWRGTGHSLHPTSDSTGLSRPLLVSSKNNNLGLGKKQHKTSDLWWMNAFDKSLKGLDTSVEGQVKQTVTSGGLDMVVKGGARFVGNNGGLYNSFVKGEVLGGTLPETLYAEEFAVKPLQDCVVADRERSKKKRKRNDIERESKDERRARKAEKRAGKVQIGESSSEEKTRVERPSKNESKEERRLRKSLKRTKKAQKAISKVQESENVGVDETREERKTRKSEKREKKAQKALTKDSLLQQTDEGYLSKTETKEERRGRRQKKKVLGVVRHGTGETIPERSSKRLRME